MAADHAAPVERIGNVGYYRLSGYWHIFRQPDGSFREGTRFSDVWALYTFDRQLRLVVLDAIERVEVYLRTQVANGLAQWSGPFGYMDRQSDFPRLSDGDYRKLMAHCKSEYRRSSETFVAHFRGRYGDSHELPPYWMLANIADFGTVFTMYRGAPVEVRNEIAASLGVSTKVLDSWVMALNTTRNRCAHHARLWNRELGTKPKIPNARSDARWHEPYEVEPGRIFGVLTILSYLLERAVRGAQPPLAAGRAPVGAHGAGLLGAQARKLPHEEARGQHRVRPAAVSQHGSGGAGPCAGGGSIHSARTLRH